jgi:hypothetical protein
MTKSNEAFPNHTVAGKLLIIATVCFAMAAFVFVVQEGTELFPSSFHPTPLFLCAIAPVVLAFHALGALLLRVLGVPIRKPSRQDEPRGMDPGPPPAS